jgi:hypothetical protein
MPSNSALTSFLVNIPVYILTAEFFVGGIPRLSPFPLERLHGFILQKTQRTAPHIYPLIPIRAVRPQMQAAGLLMCFTSLLLAMPKTRGGYGTLGMVLYLTGVGAYSQSRAGLKFWLPIVNATIGFVVFWIEKMKTEGKV